MTSTVSKTLLSAARKAGPDEEVRCQVLLEYASTNRALQAALQRELALAGLSEAGFAILATLQASKSQALYRTDLGSATGLSPARVENAVGRLETSRLVDRGRDTADRRLVLLRLNPMGRERLEHALRQYVTTVANIMGSFDLTDMSTCLDLCAKIRGAAVASVSS